MPNSLLLRSAEILAFFFLSFSAGWIIHGWKYDSQYKAAFLAQQEDVQEQVVANQQLSDKYQQQVAENRKTAGSINDHIKTEIVEKPIYIECNVPASGLQLLNQTVAAINQTRSP